MNDSDHNNTMMSVRQRNNRRRLMQELDILPPRPVLFPCFSSFNSSYAACCAKWSTSNPTSSTDIDRIGDVNKSNININIINSNSNSNSNINKDSISYFDLYPTLVEEEEEEDSYSSITSTLPSTNIIDKKLTSSSFFSSPSPSTPITLPSSPCDTLESLNSTSTTTKEDNDDSNDAITFITGSPVSTTTTTTIIMSDDMRNDENENENEDDTNTNTNTTDDYFDCTMIDMPDMTPNICTTGIDFSRFSSSSSSSSRSRRASSPPKTTATTKSTSYVSKKDNNNNDRYRLLFLQTIAVEVFRILFSAVMVDNKRTKKRRKTKKSQAYKV